mgnify:CR=1 FL=1
METKPSHVRLVIGLGNPGAEYERTYHNAGIFGLTFIQNALASRYPDVSFLSSPLFMNESGVFVSRQLHTRTLSPSQLLIVHDDSDLALGNFKLSFNRSAAGHRGVTSISNSLGSTHFWRLRIGVRAPQDPSASRIQAGDFVLLPMDISAIGAITQALERALPTISEILKSPAR